MRESSLELLRCKSSWPNQAESPGALLIEVWRVTGLAAEVVNTKKPAAMRAFSFPVKRPQGPFNLGGTV
jgi:hypothetical protein